MKRTCSTGRFSGGGNDFDIRKNKVQKRLALPGWFVEGLGANDVWWHIMDAHQRAVWMEKWKCGCLQIFRCEFDDGTLLMREWHFSQASMRFFNAWWGFLGQSKVAKRRAGCWRQMTICSARYLRADEATHKFESYHVGAGEEDAGFYVTTGSVNDVLDRWDVDQQTFCMPKDLEVEDEN